jgi:hypothetical protein
MVLSGCCWWDSHRWSAAGGGFKLGAPRDVILQELEFKEAKVLDDTPEMVLAEYQTRRMARPMKVELAFTAGKLARVNYLPE